MQKGQKSKGWGRHLRCPKPGISVYIGALFVLLMGAAAHAVTSSDELAVEAGGMKISLQLASPEGAKVVFQRADHARR